MNTHGPIVVFVPTMNICDDALLVILPLLCHFVTGLFLYFCLQMQQHWGWHSPRVESSGAEE
jgi:hypothetical protein